MGSGCGSGVDLVVGLGVGLGVDLGLVLGGPWYILRDEESALLSVMFEMSERELMYSSLKGSYVSHRCSSERKNMVCNNVVCNCRIDSSVCVCVWVWT